MKVEVFLLSCGLCAGAMAQNADELFSRGNAAYSSSKYVEAIQAFQSLASEGHATPEVLFNLGNAQFRSGDAGHAILQYERALWMSPRDPDVKANLQFARRAGGVEDADERGWQKVARTLTLNGWMWLALSAWVLVNLFAALFFWSRNRRRWGFLMTVSVGLLAFCVAGAWERSVDLKTGIVTALDASLKVAPIENSPSLEPVTAGMRVRTKKSMGAFVYVETADGKRGWMTPAQFELIIPPK